MERALVILNPHARRGAGIREYGRVRSRLEARFVLRHTVIDSSQQWRRDLDAACREGVERVISAGGDGTLHMVANALMHEGPSTVALGAIGLGSSNDFHKPCHAQIHGIPLRVGVPRGRDVGLATWEDDAGATQRRYFFVSASIGVCARANRHFARTACLGVSPGIAAAAVTALLTHRNVRARVRGRDVLLTNVSVMLTPYLAGTFRYETDVRPDHGHFALHLCTGMNRRRLFGTMRALRRGRFGGAGMASWSSRSSTVDLERDEDLELDGELFRARSIRFELLPNALAVCS